MNSIRMRELVCLFCLTTFSAGALAEDDARLARLDERRETFKEAFVKADVAVLESIVAPHYTHTNDQAAPLDREGWLATMRARQDNMSEGENEITQFDSQYFPVKVHGDTAIVTGTTTLRGLRNKEEYGLRINFTHVWEWDGTEWYRVAFHDTYQSM